MNKNQRLLITQVDNGFIVSESYNDAHHTAFESMVVFQSMSELVNFLEDHFDHRCASISADEVTIIRGKHENPL